MRKIPLWTVPSTVGLALCSGRGDEGGQQQDCAHQRDRCGGVPGTSERGRSDPPKRHAQPGDQDAAERKVDGLDDAVGTECEFADGVADRAVVRLDGAKDEGRDHKEDGAE